MTFAISRTERYWLAAMLAFRFFVADDLRLDRGHPADASPEQLTSEFGDDMRLLADLGWFDRQLMAALEIPFAEREEYEVTLLSPQDLAASLERLRGDAVAACAHYRDPNTEIPDLRHEDRVLAFQQAAEVCGAVLARLRDEKEQPQ